MTAHAENSWETIHDVAIIGLGPVGATLSAILAARGVKVLAVDAAADIFNLPRALGLDHEVMRVFQGLGLAEKMMAVTSAYKPTEYRTSTGEVIHRFKSPEAPFPLAWPPYLTFLQPDLERVLRNHVRDSENVEMHLATEVTGLAEDADLNRLTLRDKATGKTRTECARFVVGCDGGNSFVRNHLGIRFEDLVFDEPWIVVDMLLEQDVALPDVNIQYCDPARPHTFVIGPNNLRRWEFMLLPGEDPVIMSSEASVWSLLSPWLKPGQARLWRAAAYRFHALVAERWQKGRIFLAGDACHMTPPFLAQGMVQGIKDAVNLGWKLAAVLNGAPESLLESYERERRPLVREVIFITKGLGGIICERDPEAAEKRNEKMRKELAASSGAAVRQDLFPPIAAGPFCQPQPGIESAVGRPAPQPEIQCADDEFKRLDDLVDGGFQLFARPGFMIDEATRSRLSALGIGFHIIATTNESGTMTERHTLFRDWMEKHGANAILVRPDRIVLSGLGTSEALPALLETLEPVLLAA